MSIDTITTESGLVITLHDQTSHYFGGYFHVKVLVQCQIGVSRDYFDNEADFTRALSLFGAGVPFEQVLEKMAVPEADVVPVRDSLILAFRSNAHGYMAHPDFARRFVRNAYVTRIKKPLRAHAAPRA